MKYFTLLLIITSLTLSQGLVGGNLSSLKLSAKSLALQGTNGSKTDNLSSFYQNPASLSAINKHSVLYSKMEFIADISYQRRR